jgi:hypothetical protein
MSSVGDILNLAESFERSVLSKIAKPSFIADQKIWNRAKRVTKKYWKKYENKYPVIVHVYEQMGGKIKKRKKKSST